MMRELAKLTDRLNNYREFTWIPGRDKCIYVVKAHFWPIKGDERRPIIQITYNGDGFFEIDCGTCKSSSFGLIYYNEPEYKNLPKFVFTLDSDDYFIPYLRWSLCPVLKKIWQNKRGT